MQVIDYCTLLDRVQIITPRNIKFIDDVAEDDESNEDYYASTHAYQLSERHCACGEQLRNYQQKFCSLICSQKYKQKNYFKKTPIYKKCPACGEVKEFKKKGQLTCSGTCSNRLKAKNRWKNGGF